VNVRRYYAKRICVLGAESTGTTTLTEALARHYQTLWVPEVGRFYTYGKVTGSDESAKWYSQEFDYIARAQNEMEDQLAGYANKLLFCDTDSFATSVWHERYMGYESAAVEKLFKSRHYDLYVVTDVDIPFVQDGIRDGEHIREEMHKRFIELLKFHKKPFIVVSGSVEDRIEQVVKKIDSTTTSV
jgi:NadR type nicotinamide-nucleotide adenylyltransferase